MGIQKTKRYIAIFNDVKTFDIWFVLLNPFKYYGALLKGSFRRQRGALGNTHTLLSFISSLNQCVHPKRIATLDNSPSMVFKLDNRKQIVLLEIREKFQTTEL